MKKEVKVGGEEVKEEKVPDENWEKIKEEKMIRENMGGSNHW